jgi:hypothetical protein
VYVCDSECVSVFLCKDCATVRKELTAVCVCVRVRVRVRVRAAGSAAEMRQALELLQRG